MRVAFSMGEIPLFFADAQISTNCRVALLYTLKWIKQEACKQMQASCYFLRAFLIEGMISRAMPPPMRAVMS